MRRAAAATHHLSTPARCASHLPSPLSSRQHPDLSPHAPVYSLPAAAIVWRAEASFDEEGRPTTSLPCCGPHWLSMDRPMAPTFTRISCQGCTTRASGSRAERVKLMRIGPLWCPLGSSPWVGWRGGWFKVIKRGAPPSGVPSRQVLGLPHPDPAQRSAERAGAASR